MKVLLILLQIAVAFGGYTRSYSKCAVLSTSPALNMRWTFNGDSINVGIDSSNVNGTTYIGVSPTGLSRQGFGIGNGSFSDFWSLGISSSKDDSCSNGCVGDLYCFSNSNGPTVDDVQSLTSILVNVDNGVIYGEFVRKLNTNDSEDSIITQNTMVVIFGTSDTFVSLDRKYQPYPSNKGGINIDFSNGESCPQVTTGSQQITTGAKQVPVTTSAQNISDSTSGRSTSGSEGTSKTSTSTSSSSTSSSSTGSEISTGSRNESTTKTGDATGKGTETSSTSGSSEQVTSTGRTGDATTSTSSAVSTSSSAPVSSTGNAEIKVYLVEMGITTTIEINQTTFSLTITTASKVSLDRLVIVYFTRLNNTKRADYHYDSSFYFKEYNSGPSSKDLAYTFSSLNGTSLGNNITVTNVDVSYASVGVDSNTENIASSAVIFAISYAIISLVLAIC